MLKATRVDEPVAFGFLIQAVRAAGEATARNYAHLFISDKNSLQRLLELPIVGLVNGLISAGGSEVDAPESLLKSLRFMQWSQL